MIAKIGKRGSSVSGLVRYLFGPGKANEHRDQRIIAADEALMLVDGLRLDGPQDGERVAELAAGMDSHRRLAAVAPAGGWVWHCALSLAPGERLSDAQWAQAARHTMQKLGFTADAKRGRAACRWIAVHHGPSAQGNDHVHLAVNLVREDGTVATPAGHGRDRKAMSRVCAELEKRFGLKVVEGRAGRGMPGHSRAEVERARRERRPEPERVTLARQVRAAAVLAADPEEFFARLRTWGVLVRPRYAPGTTTPTGYAVAAKPKAGASPVWFGGGRLAADLTLPRLADRHWHGPTTAVDAEQAVEALASVPKFSGEATTARTAAHAAALLAVAATRWEDAPGPLAAAGDVLARAAQTPRPHRTPDPNAGLWRGIARACAAVPGMDWLARFLTALTRLSALIARSQHAQRQVRRARETTAAAREHLAPADARVAAAVEEHFGPDRAAAAALRSTTGPGSAAATAALSFPRPPGRGGGPGATAPAPRRPPRTEGPSLSR